MNQPLAAKGFVRVIKDGDVVYEYRWGDEPENGVPTLWEFERQAWTEGDEWVLHILTGVYQTWWRRTGFATWEREVI